MNGGPTLKPQLQVRGGEPNFLSGGVPDAFAVGSSLDGLAAAQGKEPLQFLLSTLAHGRGLDPQVWGRGRIGTADHHPIDIGRMRNVLLLAVARSGWRSPLSPRQARGIAGHHTPLTYVATVARVAVAHDGRVSVPRIDLTVDCGMVTHADRVAETLRAGARSAIGSTLQGNSAAPARSHGRDQVAQPGGAVDIRIHIVRSEEPPGALSEAAVSSVMAALVNAIFAATGHRPQALPVDPAQLRVH